jgi:hypothetical protein
MLPIGTWVVLEDGRVLKIIGYEHLYDEKYRYKTSIEVPPDSPWKDNKNLLVDGYQIVGTIDVKEAK